MFVVKQSGSDSELQAILKLRYKVLRAPWNQPASTATDDLETLSINAYIENDNGEVIACGRLQKNEHKTGQIRFMAVDNNYQGKGLGRKIVEFLECKGKEMGLLSIELQARENAVKFYESCGYNTKEKSFLLWDIIQHFLMRKDLRN